MYYKCSTGTVLVQKSADFPGWVQWMHHSEGKTHCDECMKLDGCFFLQNKHLPCPHHPYCHCTLEPVDYSVVLMNAEAHSEYSKYDPYLFDLENFYRHGKDLAFEKWGHTLKDADWLQKELERQAIEKYLSGEYMLGKLDRNGQRASIRVAIPRRDKEGSVSFITGWMIMPNGKLKLNTPYGGE